MSYSKYTTILEKYYQEKNPEFPRLRDRIRELLSTSEELDQVVQLVGKSALGDGDKITLDVATLIKEDFLQQNGYSDYDQFCPEWKTFWMMKAMMGFHDEAQKAIQQGHAWNKVRDATSDIQTQLRSMKFEVPSEGEEKITKKVSPFRYLMSSGQKLTIVIVRGARAEDEREVCQCHGRVGEYCISRFRLYISAYEHNLSTIHAGFCQLLSRNSTVVEMLVITLADALALAEIRSKGL